MSRQGRKGGGESVPRLSKKRKQEWALFLNDRNRITYNGLCRKYQHDCKQSFRVAVIECLKYESKRKGEQSGKQKSNKRCPS